MYADSQLYQRHARRHVRAVAGGAGLLQTALVLLGMVAFFAELTRTLMTGFVIVMEMTNSSEMIIPLMAAALIAANISRMLSRQTLYGGQAKALLQEITRKQDGPLPNT